MPMGETSRPKNAKLRTTIATQPSLLAEHQRKMNNAIERTLADDMRKEAERKRKMQRMFPSAREKE